MSEPDQKQKTFAFVVYPGLTLLDLAQTPGYIRWTFTVNFEKTQGKLTLVIKEDGNQIEGVHFE